MGILFNIEELEYFAPLTSPKKKHKTMKNTIDFLKIDDGNLGAVNFNNMIPVRKKQYKLVDLNQNVKDKSLKKYHKLLQEQLNWLNAHYLTIISKSYKLYELYNSGRLSTNIKNRCCNFKLLEEKCLAYNK